MTKKELSSIKASRRWPIKFSDFYRHYFFILFPLGGIFIGMVELYSGFKHNYDDLKLPGIIEVTIFIILLVFTLKRLYQNQVFEECHYPNLSEENFKILLMSLELQNVKYYKLGYFQCTSRKSWFSWGEEVTIVFCKNYVLINSRPYNQPITLQKDRKNIKMIMLAISKQSSE